MIQYPAGLPCFVREGYDIETVSPLMRTQMVTGRSRQRRRYKSTPTYVSATTKPMTDVQAQLFEAWWEEVLISGSQYFECPLKTPLGMQTYTARFVDIYDGPELVGVSHWQFRCELELRNRPILPPGWAIYAPDFIANSGRFDILMNDTWPEA